MRKEIDTDLKVITGENTDVKKDIRETNVTKKGHTNPLYSNLLNFTNGSAGKKFSIKDLLR